MAAMPLEREIVYPEGDGQPLAETEVHVDEIVYLIAALKEYFREQADVYVAGNLFLYYERGNRKAVVAPDLFVVRGVAKEARRTYKLWEEGVGPCFIVEVTSRSTQMEDLEEKKALYQRLGVEEYFLFDPLDEYLSPRLQGYRWVQGRYQPLLAERTGVLFSRTTGLTLQAEGPHLRLAETRTGQPLLRYDESERARRAAEERAARAEAELARLRDELAGRRGAE